MKRLPSQVKIEQRLSHNTGVGVQSGPVPDPDHALIDQHSEPIGHSASPVFGGA